MHFLDMFSEGPAQRWLHVERKWMIAGRAALDQTMSDKVRWESKPSHAMDLDGDSGVEKLILGCAICLNGNRVDLLNVSRRRIRTWGSRPH